MRIFHLSSRIGGMCAAILLLFSLAVTASAQNVKVLNVSPSAVTGGANALCTVTLSAPAPTAGLTVRLYSDSTSATVPANVVVQSGSSTATFGVPTSAVTISTVASITATRGTSAVTANLVIEAPTIKSLALSPHSVVGGVSTTGTVTLGAAAPAAGLTVELASDSPSASPPPTVTVAGGATSATFAVATSPVSCDRAITLYGTLGTTASSAILTVKAPILLFVGSNPNSIVGGAAGVGTVTIGSPAPAAGLSIALSSDSSFASVPATVLISGGATSATFAITTSPVAITSVATLSATLNGLTKIGKVTVKAPALVSVKMNPLSVAGGTSSTGTVTLGSAAPAVGLSIALSSDSSFAIVPSSASVAGGATTATFTVDTAPVPANSLATISATLNGATKSGTLTVRAPGISTLQINPASAVAGTTVTGTVTLTGSAPASGYIVALSSLSLSAAAPSSVTVAGGASSATFTIQAGPSAGKATIGASLNGTTKSATITVTGGSPWPVDSGNLLDWSLGSLSKAAGQIKWICPGVGGQVVFGLDGTLYGSQGGSPFAINPTNGQLIINTSVWGGGGTPAIGPDGTVYAVCGTSLCALNPRSLDLEWSVQLDATGGAQVTFGLNGEIIVNGGDTVYGISPLSRAIDWSCACWEGGATVGSTGVIYLANPFATSVFATAVSPSGAVLWQNSTLPQYSSSRLVEDGKGNLFTMGGDGRLYALSAATGVIEWSSSQICQVANSANNGCDVSLDSAGNLYFEGLDLVTGNQSAYAFNVGTRTVNWEIQIDGPTSRSYEKPAIAANGIAYFASWSGWVFAIETATGHVNWSINVGAGVGLIGAREVEIGGDGTVYVETFNGNAVIAIK